MGMVVIIMRLAAAWTRRIVHLSTAWFTGMPAAVLEQDRPSPEVADEHKKFFVKGQRLV
jgi:hypothetical protein